MHDVTVAVMNYNGKAVLGDTLDSLSRLSTPPAKVVVVDNGSSDGSPDWVRRNYRSVEVVELGTAARSDPNRARNWALENVETRYVLLLDNDMQPDTSCLDRLMEGIRARPDVFACAPVIIFTEDPEIIFRGVSSLHFLCVSGPSARGMRLAQLGLKQPTPTLPGGTALVDRQLLDRVGFFNRAYDFGWGDDAELYLRARLAGYQCHLVPTAIIDHPTPGHGTRRAEAQIHNRYRILLTMYAGRTLVLLAPLLLLFEIAFTLVGLVTGLGRAQLSAIRRIFRGRAQVAEERRRIQEARAIRDADILVGEGISGARPLTEKALIGWLVRLANAALRSYWWLVRRWV